MARGSTRGEEVGKALSRELVLLKTNQLREGSNEGVGGANLDESWIGNERAIRTSEGIGTNGKLGVVIEGEEIRAERSEGNEGEDIMKGREVGEEGGLLTKIKKVREVSIVGMEGNGDLHRVQECGEGIMEIETSCISKE